MRLARIVFTSHLVRLTTERPPFGVDWLDGERIRVQGDRFTVVHERQSKPGDWLVTSRGVARATAADCALLRGAN